MATEDRETIERDLGEGVKQIIYWHGGSRVYWEGKREGIGGPPRDLIIDTYGDRKRAYLYATAPEMYEVLKLALTAFKAKDWLTTHGAMSEIIEKVLAKAEGKEA